MTEHYLPLPPSWEGTGIFFFLGNYAYETKLPRSITGICPCPKPMSGLLSFFSSVATRRCDMDEEIYPSQPPACEWTAIVPLLGSYDVDVLRYDMTEHYLSLPPDSASWPLSLTSSVAMSSVCCVAIWPRSIIRPSPLPKIEHLSPSVLPSPQPSQIPTCQPSAQPTMKSSLCPSIQPSNKPSIQPSRRPSSQPSIQPSNHPTIMHYTQPSIQPSCQLNMRPSRQPTG